MQMGGNAGDGATLARQTGAAAAAKALGVDTLNEQFSGWAPEKMIEQFKQALAAKPSCIVIMGHPGNERLRRPGQAGRRPGVDRHRRQRAADRAAGRYGPKGFGYAGVDLYAGGTLTAERMIEVGKLKSGDEAMVYGVFSQAERGQSEKGLADTLEKAGLKVDRLEITQEANSDASLAVPVLAAYVQSHPDAEGHRHPAWRGHRRAGRRAEEGRQEAGRRHRRRHRPGAGHHRRPAERLCQRHPRPAALSAGLHAGPAMRADQVIQDAGPVAEHRRRRDHRRRPSASWCR